jgi:hypothetical protein
MMQQIEEFCTVTAFGVYSCLWTLKVNGYLHYFSTFIILDDIELLQNLIPYFIIDSKYTKFLMLSAKWWIL